MFTNPIASELFLPTVYSVGGLLAMALVALLLRSRGRWPRLRDDVLFHRWRTWAVIAPVYVLAVLGGPVPTLVMVSLIILQGLHEYSRLVGLNRNFQIVLLAMGAAAAPVALVSIDAFRILPPLLLMVATLQPLFFGGSKANVRDLAFGALGWGLIAWFLAHLVLTLIYVDEGPALLLILGLSVALSDVGAFVTGKAFGKHKFAPRISPNKTWEGVLGSVIGAYLGVGLMFFAVPDKSLWLLLSAFPLVIALGAVWGDLIESAIKREFGAKDAGGWLPGFGGILDRIDSLLIAAPLTYYFLIAV